MNIQHVIARLLKTIEDKEQLLKEFRDQPMCAQILKLNITELSKILNDCMAVREADIVRELERKDNTPPKGTHDYI